ncbi:MAG: hypothetical protein HYT87_17570 [Nitrospirae bacterium]|nr:hypothetical protein [Nitrospirota bacterium]
MSDEHTQLPIVAYIHRDSDAKDTELVGLMSQFEKDPKNVDTVCKIARKRVQQGDVKLARMWLEYALAICEKDLKHEIEKEIRELRRSD